MDQQATYPPTVVATVDQVSKKFCKHLKRSMAYGMLDLARAAVGRPVQTAVLRRDEFWALADISLTLKRGEALGVMGLNGSGKTTLLRLLAGILPPDKGEIRIQGRVSNLLGMGAGFHPHMTGRENIFVNGTLLGMTPAELTARLPDIAAFADLGDFLEAPVTTYSAGMRMRLGFAIATAVQPDLLLLDEVLAVGDVVFRQRCLDRIEALLPQAAVVFVSNRPEYIEKTCTHALWLDRGHIGAAGPVEEVVPQYLAHCNRESVRLAQQAAPARPEGGALQFSGPVQVIGSEASPPMAFKRQEDLTVEAGFVCHRPMTDVRFTIEIQQLSATRRLAVDTVVPAVAQGGLFRAQFQGLPLKPDAYVIHLTITADGVVQDHWRCAAEFAVVRPVTKRSKQPWKPRFTHHLEITTPTPSDPALLRD